MSDSALILCLILGMLFGMLLMTAACGLNEDEAPKAAIGITFVLGLALAALAASGLLIMLWPSITSTYESAMCLQDHSFTRCALRQR